MVKQGFEPRLYWSESNTLRTCKKLSQVINQEAKGSLRFKTANLLMETNFSIFFRAAENYTVLAVLMCCWVRAEDHCESRRFFVARAPAPPPPITPQLS